MRYRRLSQTRYPGKRFSLGAFVTVVLTIGLLATGSLVFVLHRDRRQARNPTMAEENLLADASASIGFR